MEIQIIPPLPRLGETVPENENGAIFLQSVCLFNDYNSKIICIKIISGLSRMKTFLISTGDRFRNSNNMQGVSPVAIQTKKY